MRSFFYFSKFDTFLTQFFIFDTLCFSIFLTPFRLDPIEPHVILAIHQHRKSNL